MYHASHKQGFTLLEILMVVAAIGILAGITVVAINPGRQLAKARNQTRTADVNTIRNALKEYSLDNQGQVPDGITGKLKNICQSDASSCDTNSDRVNLSVIEQYLAEEALPVDPKKSDGSNVTGYEVAVSTQGNYKVKAPNAENNETIAVGPDEVTGYLLTLYPNTAAAYSVRLLREEYTGPAFTIRRDSDNETENIGFSGIDLDTEAINDFCGTSNCYVTTWHDQSGNDKDATQSTNDNQPKIYDSGDKSVVKENGKPALDFDGSDDFLKNNSFSSFMEGEDKVISTFAVEKLDSTGGTQTSFGFENSSDNNPLYLKRLEGTNGETPQYIKRDGTGTLRQTSLNTTASTNQVLETGIIENSGQLLNIYENGSLLKSDFDIDVGTLTLDIFTIGAERRDTNTSFLNGKMQEMIIYSSDQSANRSDIETNINDYFEIY